MYFLWETLLLIFKAKLMSEWVAVREWESEWVREWVSELMSEWVDERMSGWEND